MTSRSQPLHPSPVLARGTAVGRYLVLDFIGSGGMGVVYSAYDPGLDRKIALKLLPPSGPHGASSPEGRFQLQREARALARLSNPHVVTVYDVGSDADQVFVAMELVDGQTLGKWLSSEQPSWQQVVRCFVEAGRGLAAAHAVGLVHRDFKPDNVLVGRDGKVRVTDFGLARVTRPVSATPPGEEAARTASLGGSRSGAQAGTPRYMAPEQWQGKETGPWADQFSFCVALWEALYGEPPFAGDTPAELAQEVTSGRPRSVPAHRQGVPAWLHAALVRGLQTEPTARHPSMEALLALLEHDPIRRRRRVAALLGSSVLLLALLGVGALWWTRRPAELCAGGPSHVLSVWGDSTREGVRRGLLASGAPAAGTTWELLARSVDAYTRDWATMHREACEATRVRGEQSEELLDRRMLCLNRALQRVSALARQLEHADRATADKALNAAYALPPLSECANAEVLLDAPELPRDATVRQQVLALREQMVELETLRDLGRLKEALPRAEALTRTAEALHFHPVQAEALLLEGNLRRLDEQHPRAAELLNRAVLRAEAGHEDKLAALAWIDLAVVDSIHRKELAAARRSIEHAQAKLDRLGRPDPSLETQMLGVRASLADAEGHYDEALALDQERVKLMEQTLGPDAPKLGGALHNLAASLHMRGRLDEAYAAIQRSLVLTERHWGPDSLTLASGLNLLAIIARNRHQYPEARAAYERSLRIYAHQVGERSSNYSQTLANLALLLSTMGEHEAALSAFQRAVDIERGREGGDSSRLATILNNMAVVYNRLGRPSAALALCREALEIRTAKFGLRHVMVGATLDTLGVSLRKLGQFAQALEHFQREQEIFVSAFPEDHPYMGNAHYQIGMTLLELGRTAQARASLERALSIYERHPEQRQEQAEVRFGLARLEWKNGGPDDRLRARQRLLELREQVDSLTRAEMDAWLEAHPASP
ncbi:tetratricopeptide repeat protein [Archangium violaceum]|uniref:tetratricopeptide repeat protein n=1 Tax=Archangium violaceum TaxID=83451 RepID=UPI0037BF93A5